MPERWQQGAVSREGTGAGAKEGCAVWSLAGTSLSVLGSHFHRKGATKMCSEENSRGLRAAVGHMLPRRSQGYGHGALLSTTLTYQSTGHSLEGLPQSTGSRAGRDGGSGADRNPGFCSGSGYRAWAASCRECARPPDRQLRQQLGPAAGRQQPKFRRPHDPQSALPAPERLQVRFCELGFLG